MKGVEPLERGVSCEGVGVSQFQDGVGDIFLEIKACGRFVEEGVDGILLLWGDELLDGEVEFCMSGLANEELFCFVVLLVCRMVMKLFGEAGALFECIGEQRRVVEEIVDEVWRVDGPIGVLAGGRYGCQKDVGVCFGDGGVSEFVGFEKLCHVAC